MGSALRRISSSLPASPLPPGVAMRWFVIGLCSAAGMRFCWLWEFDKVQPSYMKAALLGRLSTTDCDPQGVGWQQTRGLMALGGGKLTGEGLSPRHPDAEQRQRRACPARHTDFIFCTIGEELGYDRAACWRWRC